MRISLHGGSCCGVKHIHGLGHYPDCNLAARVRYSKGQTSFRAALTASYDMMHGWTGGKRDFFNEAAPTETYKERFNRFVEFIKKNRSHGVIEVVLNSSQVKWKSIIEKHGFKEVSSGLNSNTHCKITIYHLVY